jgi:hypothetical protein
MRGALVRIVHYLSRCKRLHGTAFLHITTTIMARASFEIIRALRNTAHTLQQSTAYQWGHMGLCNCGFLAQEITHLRKEQIHARAMQRSGDWNELLNDYCPTSGHAMDELIHQMLAFGFDQDDLKHLEKLSDRKVIASLPPAEQGLKQNVKEDVIKYFLAWAALLENELIDNIRLPAYVSKEETIL